MTRLLSGKWRTSEPLTNRERRRLFEHLWASGTTKLRTLMKGAGVSKQTAYNYLHKLEKGESLEPKPAKISPRKLTPKVVRSIHQIIAKNPFYNTRQIIIAIKENTNVVVSDRTVRRVLHEAGFKYGQPKRPRMTDENQKERLEFAKKNLHTDWKRMWAFDEHYANLQFGSPFCWYNDEVYDRVASLRLTNRQDSVSIPIAVAISRNHKSKICFLPKGWRPQDLVQVLDHELLPDLGWDATRRQFRAFIIDNDGRHKSRAVMTVLEENGLVRNGWLPPNSPDLNPIENVFGIMRSYIRQKMPSTEAQLKEALEEAWETITPDILQNLFDSLPRRMRR